MMFAKVDSSPCDIYVLVTRREAGRYGEKIGRLVQERDPGGWYRRGKEDYERRSALCGHKDR